MNPLNEIRGELARHQPPPSDDFQLAAHLLNQNYETFSSDQRQAHRRRHARVLALHLLPAIMREFHRELLRRWRIRRGPEDTISLLLGLILAASFVLAIARKARGPASGAAAIELRRWCRTVRMSTGRAAAPNV